MGSVFTDPISQSLLRDLLVNGDLLALLVLALETHDAIDEGEQRVVLALTDVHAGMDLGSALTDEDVTGQNELTVGWWSPCLFYVPKCYTSMCQYRVGKGIKR